MITPYSISALILAYMFGSIPTAVWIGMAFYGVDVREYGSGNAGATNTFGVTTTGGVNSIPYTNYELALGIAAVMGHLFPVFAGFRGGKGIATLFGMILAIHFHAALLCVVVFIIVLLVFRYVSLGSILAGFTYLLGVTFVFPSNRSVVIYGMCMCLLILVTHQKNIERLLKGTESKVNLFKKKKAVQ
jgi:glycerol-3-phosphate acyltransferase PlsY